MKNKFWGYITPLLFISLFYLIISFLFYRSYSLQFSLDFTVKYFFITFTFILIQYIFLIYHFLPRINENEDEHSSPVSFKNKELIVQSEKLEIENRLYRILFDSIEGPLFVFNQKKEISFMNEACAKLFGLKKENLPFPIIEVSRNLSFQNFIDDSLRQNKNALLNQYTFDDEQDPKRIYFDIKITPIKFTSHYLCAFQDITEKKFADQMREDFISNFSHEIRTPLTILNAQIQSLKIIATKEETSTPLLDSAFQKIENNSRRLTNLFDDMLNLSAIEKQKLLHYEEFDIEPLVQNITQEIVLKYPLKNITFSINLAPDATTFKCDYNLLDKAIINLIDNAIKYSGQGPHVTISTRKESDYLALSIEDNGPGIPEDLRHRIFERFFRIDISRSSEISGTGLGLSIVKHIVSKHNGKIKVQNGKESGTMITLFFRS